VTGVPFRVFVATGKWAFLSALAVLLFVYISQNDVSRYVGMFGRTEFEVWLFNVQVILFISLVAFIFGNFYGFAVWVITSLCFDRPLSTHYVRNIVLLCAISSAGLIILGRSHDYGLRGAFNAGMMPLLTGGTLWTAFLGNRFAVNYLRSQQKQKNAAV
jgi:hypothetical protein